MHTLPVSLQSIRLYGKGEESNPTLKRGDYISDLDFDTLLEMLKSWWLKKDARLQTLRPIEGCNPVIPRAKEVPEYADEDHSFFESSQKDC